MIGTKVLEEQKSEFNGNLCVVKTFGMGTYIQSEGLTQSGGIVKTIWKQTLNRLNHLTKKIFNNVLILGLGGGTVAKLIRKKYPNAKITGVEIDPIMIELGKKYLDLDKTGVDIKNVDAQEFLTKGAPSVTKYDLVVVDLYNGSEFPKQFEEEKYIKLIKNILQKNGLIIFNRLYYGDKRPDTVKFGRSMEKVFSKVIWFYPEANLMFICTK